MKTKVEQNNNHESGITLIALIIMIIILVVLAAVTIRGLTGETGIIDTTQVAAEEYKIEQYKEQLLELRENAIAEYSMMGKSITMQNLAELMQDSETIWTKSIHANVGDADTNDDILATTTDGYLYQIYYDELTGQRFIEYVGKGEEENLPKIKTEYDKKTAGLNFKVKDKNGVAKVEILHRGTIYTDNATDETETSLDFNGEKEVNKTVTLQKMGWYIVKVTSSKGYYRYAWIRVTSSVVAPIVEIKREQEDLANSEHGGWYGGVEALKKVEVRIHTENETATDIYYKVIVNGKDEELEQNTEHNLGNGWQSAGSTNKTITLPEQSGTIKIIAFSVDKKGNESENGVLDVLYDNVKPELHWTITPNLVGKQWHTSNVEISLATSTDANSLVSGYEWRYAIKDPDYDSEIEMTEDGKSAWTVVDTINITKVIDKDGIRTLEFKVKDNAGNVSDPIQIEVRRDTEKPTITSAQVPEESKMPRSFQIQVVAEDNLSGDSEREGSLTYSYYISDAGKEVKKAEGIAENTYDATGLTVNKTYTAYVKVKDEAGNETTSAGIKGASTYGIMADPSVTVDGPHKGNPEWYTEGEITVEVIDPTTQSEATKDKTGIDHFEWRIDGGETHRYPGEKPQFEDGTHQLAVWGVDEQGNSTNVITETIKRDTKAPNPPTITPNDEGWKTTSTVEVIITRGTDEGEGTTGSGANKISYSGIDGESSQGDTATTVTKTINRDGTYTVTAKTIDVAGNESAEAKAIVKKDSTPPTAEIEYDANKRGTEIQVTGKGTDATSKVASYIFQYRETGTTEWKSESPYTTANTSQGHTYHLTAGKTYNIRVKVTDNAGNVAYSDGAKPDGTGGNAPTVNTECAEADHKWTEKITKNATCTDSGSKTLTCSVCNKTKTETIPAKGHTPGSKETIKEPTCTGTGTYQVHCTVCGAQTDSGILPANGHTSGSWVVETEASCDKTGTKVKKCTVCGTQLDTMNYGPLDHNYQYYDHYDGDCRNKSYDEYRCSYCHNSRYEYGELGDHKWELSDSHYGDWSYGLSRSSADHPPCSICGDSIHAVYNLYYQCHTENCWYGTDMRTIL